MTRGGDGWDDVKCLVCAGIVPGNGWSTVDRGAAAAALAPRGRCSWCGRNARHVVARVVGRRGTYVSHCSMCARATHACARCGEAFAKIGDGRCAKCAGWVRDWDAEETDANEGFHARARVVGWCSWCGELCAHARRGVNEGEGGKNPEVFECATCGGGTARCERCGDEERMMRKRSRPGGAGSCARCDVDDETQKKIRVGAYVSIPSLGSLARSLKDMALSGSTRRAPRGERAIETDEMIEQRWNVRTARREAADESASFVFDVLDRESEYRDKAYRAGLIRPFLLLATLPPRERVRLGMRLGIALHRSSAYLDPHAEAWKLLRDPVCGLQTRGGNVSHVVEKVTGVGRGANWIDILYSTLTLGATTGSCPASEPCEIDALPNFRSSGHAMFALRVASHPALAQFEVATIRLVSRAQRGRLAPASTGVLESVCRHPRMSALKTRMARAYPRDADEISRHAVTAAFASSAWASFERPLTPVDVEAVAEDVFGMLLDGAPLTQSSSQAEHEDAGDDSSADAHVCRGAPSLLGALAASTSIGLASFTAAQFAPTKFAVLTPRDIMDLTTSVRTPALTSSGIFEPVAVMLVHNVLLAARSVHVDDHLPADAARLSRDALDSAQTPSVAAPPTPTSALSPGSPVGNEPASPWSPKYAHLGVDDAEARLDELENTEASDMLMRYINALDTSDLYVGDDSVLSSENLSDDDD